MTLAEIETCVRERLHFVTVVFNDNSLSLIDTEQQRRGLPVNGVRYGSVDFAAAAAAMGAWGRRVSTTRAAWTRSRAEFCDIFMESGVDSANHRFSSQPDPKAG